MRRTLSGVMYCPAGVENEIPTNYVCYGRFARTGRNGGLSILTAASAEPGVNETPETTAWETSRKIRLDWKEVKYCPAGVET